MCPILAIATPGHWCPGPPGQRIELGRAANAPLLVSFHDPHRPCGSNRAVTASPVPPFPSPALPYVANHSAASHLPISDEVPKFDVVEAITPVGSAPCAECRGPILDSYYERNRGVVCAACQTRFAATMGERAATGGFARAAAFGVGAAAAGAAVYYATLAATGYEIGVALVVGLVVGKAVQVGSRRMGGRRYQCLAAGLTYAAIASTYVPFVVKGFDARAAEFGALLGLAMIAPLLGGAGHIVGTAILILALVQAWRMNRRVDVAVTGPYRIRPVSLPAGR